MSRRLIYADLLRVSATFSVVLLHVAASNWSYVELGSLEWNALNFYDGLARFGVPIFVMISGMFLLNPHKPINLKEIYRKYILRILKAFLIWSFLYAIYTTMDNYDTFNYDVFINSFILGHYHLWYLYMLLGLYIITPLLRKISVDKVATAYFLILSLIFVFLLPMIIKLLNLEILENLVDKLHFHFALGYTGYYMAGYYLGTYEIKRNKRNIIYILGIISSIATIILTDIVSLKTGLADATFYSYFSPTVMITSIAVFIFFKYEVSKIQFSEKGLAIISSLADSSFRIYLVHDFFNMFFSKLGIHTINYNPFLSVPVISLLVYTGSFAASYLIGKTPLLRKIL